jgi:hydroxymethylpyrimidine pyrophosphatase-like HAD family hydrolase
VCEISYSSHPFLDIYGVEFDKGLAFDNVSFTIGKKEERGINVMYLGDSENDNPQFLGVLMDNDFIFSEGLFIY